MTRPGLLLLVVLLALALGSAIRPVWTLDPDAAAYMALGRSVAAGEGYVLDELPHAKYPPGLPLLLAGATWLGGPEAYGLMHATLVGLLLLAVILAHAVARRLGVAPGPALAVAACTGLSQTFFQLSVEYLRSEVPFLVLTLAALLVLLRACTRGGSWAQVALAALLVAAAMLTRLAGVALLAVPGAVLLCRQAPSPARLRSLVLVLAGLAVLGGWMGRGRLIAAEHPEAPDYSAELLAAEPRDLTKHVRLDMPRLDGAGFARRVAGNGEVLARACATLLTNVDKAAERLPVGAALLALLLLGMFGGLANRPWAGAPTQPPDGEPHTSPDVVARRLTLHYVGGTLFLYLIWPFDQQERFYAPLLPLLLVFAGHGAGLVHDRVGRIIRGGGLGRGPLVLVALGGLGVLAAQRSEFPSILGRWSTAYAGLLAVATVLVLGLVLAVALRRWPDLPRWSPALAVLLFALPFLHQRFVRWPGIVDGFEARRAAEPVDGPLARVDVHPVLEAVARHLRESTPPDAVLMTDVPKMLALVGERRCIPFVYGVEPPELRTGDATLVFHTGSQSDAAAVFAHVTAGWPVDVSIPLAADDPDGAHVDVLRVPVP